ncbi:hypothetical protein [Nocardioides sp.]|uniref:hypothetical protein n=1 Tax=Nocardioides sp. TaxID=35761 RepID=UPI003D0B3497
MTTAQGLVQHAVRRDLERARILLSTQLSISRARREALAHHLIWLLDMVSAPDREFADAMRELGRSANEFFASAERVARRDVLVAVTELSRLQGARREWVQGCEVSTLGRQVHWLVDGLEARAGDRVTRLLNPRANMARVKLRGEVYRYRKDLLWGGTPAYVVPIPIAAR